jgi:hypothetical protein
MASSTQKRRIPSRPVTAPQRRNRGNTRRQPDSNVQKALAMLPLGKKAAPAKRSSRGGTAGKAAMLTAAAGLAYKNRDKLSALLNKRRQQPA